MDVLEDVFEALRTQSHNNFEILLVNNGGDALPLKVFQEKFDFTLVSEERIGNSWARYTAMKLCKADLLIFVDDDNILSHDYVEQAMKLAEMYPDWGAFGGRQTPSKDLKITKSKKFMLPYLAIRDLGLETLSQKAERYWTYIEPVGAGMCLTKKVVEIFLSSPNLEHYFKLGRRGRKLLSGEDSFIARQSSLIGLSYGYSPHLVLEHRILQSRLKLSYLSRLMFGYGQSDIALSRSLGLSNSDYPYKAKDALSLFAYNCIKSRYGFLLGLRGIGQYWGLRFHDKDY
jgi:glycosyltransferase involved in cell wall biosynthesis